MALWTQKIAENHHFSDREHNSSETTGQNSMKLGIQVGHHMQMFILPGIFYLPNFVGGMALWTYKIAENHYFSAREHNWTEFHKTWHVGSTQYADVHTTRKF